MTALFSFLSVMAAVLTAHAQGTLEAMVNYAATTPSDSTPLYSSIFSSINGPVGWTFQPTSSLEVTALGAFSYIVPSHGSLSVGLWDASGNLLASSTVTAASTPVDQSVYQAISPLLLSADQTYYLAAYSAAGPFSAVVVTPGAAPNGYATMSPAIQLGQVAYSSNTGFSFPSTLDGLTGYAIIAPNFEYSVVPEPSTFCLLGGGMIVVMIWRWRIKQPVSL